MSQGVQGAPSRLAWQPSVLCRRMAGVEEKVREGAGLVTHYNPGQDLAG